MRDEKGEPKSILIINTDITEKKQIEAQFLRTQRMEGIGALAGGIAHDLNNALTPLSVGIDLLRADLAGKESKRSLDRRAGSLRRAVNRVPQILNFPRGVAARHEPLRLKPLLEEMANF